MMKHAGLSVQAQDKCPLRTSIDQRGEQTMNRDAKITGGIKAFTTKEYSILKWSLTRSNQARHTRELQNLCGLSTDPGIYKPCRPSQILTTEKLVQEVIRVFREDYINTFAIGIDKNTLVNKSSGKPLKEEATEFLLSCSMVGKEKYKDFVNTQLRRKKIPVHDPIKRTKTKLLTFKSSSKKKPKTNQRKCIEVNRDILAKLLAISLASKKVIDFKKALQFALGELPLSLATLMVVCERQIRANSVK